MKVKKKFGYSQKQVEATKPINIMNNRVVGRVSFGTLLTTPAYLNRKKINKETEEETKRMQEYKLGLKLASK